MPKTPSRKSQSRSKSNVSTPASASRNNVSTPASASRSYSNVSTPAPASKSKSNARSSVRTPASADKQSTVMTSSDSSSDGYEDDDDGRPRPLTKLHIYTKRDYATLTTMHNRHKRGVMGGKILREIRHMQRSTRLAVPKLPFSRVVKEVSQDYCILPRGCFRFEAAAIEALQEAAEGFMTDFLTDSYALTRHRKRETLSVEDMRLTRLLLLDHMPCLQ